MQKFHTLKLMYSIQELDLLSYLSQTLSKQLADLHVWLRIKNCWTDRRSFLEPYISGSVIHLYFAGLGWVFFEFLLNPHDSPGAMVPQLFPG